jgi:hypothetical protein
MGLIVMSNHARRSIGNLDMPCEIVDAIEKLTVVLGLRHVMKSVLCNFDISMNVAVYKSISEIKGKAMPSKYDTVHSAGSCYSQTKR